MHDLFDVILQENLQCIIAFHFPQVGRFQIVNNILISNHFVLNVFSKTIVIVSVKSFTNTNLNHF